LATNYTTSFSNQVTAQIAALNAQLQGIVTSTVTDPYYPSSLSAYMASKSQELMNQMTMANQTQQQQINAVVGSVQTLTKSIASSFSPILSNIQSIVSVINSTDTKYLNDALIYLGDVNATVAKAFASFTSFSNNMNNLWNTTGSILSGQTTTISQELLTKIGNMTQQAGAEVANLNKIMVTAGTGALQADSVRQAILANSRNQVFTMIGNNEAALKASFATITKFMSQSQSEIKFITDVIQAISGNRAAALNKTATEAIGNVTRQVEMVQNNTNSFAQNLKKL
jgi:hypothetical protein